MVRSGCVSRGQHSAEAASEFRVRFDTVPVHGLQIEG